MAIRYDEAVEDGVTEELVCSLERPAEADDLTDAERAALRFADLFATNHLAIDDAVYDDLRRYFTEGELVEIGLNCAIDVGHRSPDRDVGRHRRPSRRVPALVLRGRDPLERRSAPHRQLTSTRLRGASPCAWTT